MENFTSRECPIVGKSFLQSRHQGTFNPKMQISNGTPGFIIEYIAVAYVHAARESRPAVQHENFTVIAKIDSRDAPGSKQRRRQELCEGNVRVFESVRDRWPGVAGAGSIN